MIMRQLNPPIPLFVVGKGLGLAIIFRDYGPDYDDLWTVIDDKTGEIWTWKNSQVRGVDNVTMGRESER